ncbi:adenylate/guanylate cyclase domain-containing protein [Antrihabitans stalactiti]|uniref:Adenylate/guanylate cyclase domain-containing protein n=1 Tax=Antrihabitans stalactiti TaxID=2584121 RepID=A0A848KIT2_9NOCA|nr:adenylate/guanylate cyclase domain-containing protein [Antrihabitans stalactiti]NMN98189.1 adenylate/guanylate cyclase domain-containing protein [Antrihabitans stalactiti]
MTHVVETVLGGVAFVEACGLVVLAALLIRSKRQVQSLQRQLVSGRDRRWLRTSRDAVRAVWDTANLVREKGISRALLSSVDVLAGWAQIERPDLAQLAARDGTVTIFFSDIEGSTALNEQLGDKAWVKLLERHDRVVRNRIELHRGHVIKTQGDGFMVAFAEPVQAVRCGIEVQRQLSDGAIRVRVGIHVGEAVRRGDDLFGLNVALTARVAAEANGGEVLVSDAVRAALVDEPDIGFGPARDVELKGLRGVYHVHPALWDQN